MSREIRECKADKKLLEACENFMNVLTTSTGDDPNREGLLDTPSRIADMYEFLLSGYKREKDIPKLLSRQFEEEDYNQIVSVTGIDYFSLCEHHLAPFFGKVHVGYIPNKKKVVGISKIPRVVDIYARRLQQQERLTYQIAEAIDKYLEPKGVIVVVEGIHLCMRSRGVETPNATMKTSAVRGVFKTDSTLEQKFLKMINTHNI